MGREVALFADDANARGEKIEMPHYSDRTKAEGSTSSRKFRVAKK
jgi:hypothetical protein